MRYLAINAFPTAVCVPEQIATRVANPIAVEDIHGSDPDKHDAKKCEGRKSVRTQHLTQNLKPERKR